MNILYLYYCVSTRLIMDIVSHPRGKHHLTASEALLSSPMLLCPWTAITLAASTAAPPAHDSGPMPSPGRHRS